MYINVWTAFSYTSLSTIKVVPLLVDNTSTPDINTETNFTVWSNCKIQNCNMRLTLVRQQQEKIPNGHWNRPSYQQSTRNITDKTKDEATRIAPKPRGYLRCSGRVRKSCCICGTRRTTHINAYSVINLIFDRSRESESRLQLRQLNISAIICNTDIP